jgi:hypothetical protein
MVSLVPIEVNLVQFGLINFNFRSKFEEMKLNPRQVYRGSYKLVFDGKFAAATSCRHTEFLFRLLQRITTANYNMFTYTSTVSIRDNKQVGPR